MHDDAEPFIWSLNYAQDNGCKNFVLDITANAGGHETILLYMMAVIAGQDKLQYICTLTGNTMETEAKYDRNFDGVFDERDDAVKYDLNFAVMATKASFSCGNLMPVIARAAGIPILGETSGGGSCIVCFMDTANDYPYNLAHIHRWLDADGNPVDFGVEPDYVLVKDRDSGSPDYTELYDLAKVQTLIEEYSAEKPASTEPAQAESTAAQGTTAAAGPGSAEKAVKTGDAAPVSAFGILLASLLLAVSARRRHEN